MDSFHELCPDFFIGWHTRVDCKEYFECNNGKIGPLYTCGEGFKFEKVSGKCLFERHVNQYCYESNNAEPNAITKSKCILGYTGWDTKPGCAQYYWCNDGNEGATLDCGEDLLFDMELELCNFADKVVCPYGFHTPTVPPITMAPSPTPSPSESPKVVSESDAFAGFDSFPTTGSPTNTINNALPPWLNDISVTFNAKCQ